MMIKLFLMYQKFVKKHLSLDKKKLNTIHTKYIRSIWITKSSYSRTDDLTSRCLL